MWDTSKTILPFPRGSILIYSSRESAATLETESGYVMESPDVGNFREYVLDGRWELAEACLEDLGVEGKAEQGVWVSPA